VFVSDILSGHWRAIAKARPDVIFYSSGEGPWKTVDTLLATAVPQAVPADTHRDEVAFWLYTSGSTGNPKGAMHCHASLRLSANLYGESVAGYRENDVVLSVAKQFFAYGLGNSLTFPYAVGATVVLHEGRASPERMSDLMKRHGVTLFGGVPTFFAKLAGERSPPCLRRAAPVAPCDLGRRGTSCSSRTGVS